MPDIAMCKGNNCPKKETCYRFTAKPNEPFQTYFVPSPVNKESGNCDEYRSNDARHK
jgi:hypothetical protein